MSRYDDFFDAAATTDSVFAEKGTLDPLADPADVVFSPGAGTPQAWYVVAV